MHAGRHSGSSHLIGGTLLYLTLALGGMAQTILLSPVPGKLTPEQSVAALGQVPAPVEVRFATDRRVDFAWLPLLSIETRPKTGIQYVPPPPLEFALPGGIPRVLWASAATWRVSATGGQ